MQRRRSIWESAGGVDLGKDLYLELGGKAVCERLATALYARVGTDPLLRPFFPGKTLHCAIAEFSAFLAQFLGGPAEVSQRRWWLSLRESHARFPIGAEHRDRWLHLMLLALDDVGIPEPHLGGLREFFAHSSAYIVNRGASPSAPDIGDPELSRRWNTQMSLDDAIAAIRKGDNAEADRICDGFRENRALFAALLAERLDCFDYVSAALRRDPELAGERFGGRTLLHAAAGAASLPIVALLLEQGADPNLEDDGGHGPLYRVANQFVKPDGARVVRALVEAGAAVDGAGGVKRTTPLHMAARRGNVEVAAVLLDLGANIEARDSLRETPLRRAVNCNQTGMAALLLARGADPDSVGSKHRTPLTAIRGPEMWEVFEKAKRSS